ncbi:alpha-isopropylmalate synthase regulatory domain-containing protein [Mycolicibacterium sp. 120270]|nr:alpha-isopropylmalate synthase regulatory domain-containing protein [Mycolicibacterium sp. 120270]MDX1884834.1 alpha-isopropylmalate synthase regulatory domain-containing protein [Mycolicibacterium sp. 120270]
MPKGLRVEADAMNWDTFRNTYAPASGPLRLGQWTCTDGDCAGPQPRHYEATLAIGDRISTATAAATGPVAALTEMLYERGIALEMTSFHQVPAGGDTATFIRGSNGIRDEWAMGLDEDATQSALRAVIACANRLLTA